MKRSSVLKLNERAWISPIENDPLEVAIVPAYASLLAGIWSGADESAVRALCRDAFVDFRGYTDTDGTPASNTIDMRVELFSRVMPVRRAIITHLQQLAEIQAEGEESADSD